MCLRRSRGSSSIRRWNYHTTTARGFLDPTPRLLADRDAGEARVGACLTIFQNVAHEALCLLSQLGSGKLRLNSRSEPVALGEGDIAVLTIIYLNDVLKPFLAYRAALLSRSEVRRAYRIDLMMVIEDVWLVMTPTRRQERRH